MTDGRIPQQSNNEQRNGYYTEHHTKDLFIKCVNEEARWRPQTAKYQDEKNMTALYF